LRVDLNYDLATRTGIKKSRRIGMLEYWNIGLLRIPIFHHSICCFIGFSEYLISYICNYTQPELNGVVDNETG